MERIEAKPEQKRSHLLSNPEISVSYAMTADVCLRTVTSVAADALLAEVNRRRPAGFDPMVRLPGEALVLQSGACVIEIAPVAAAIPMERLAHALRGAIKWPLARYELASHQAHIRLTGRNASTDRPDAVRLAIALTWVAAALARVQNGLGMYWPDGDVLSSAAQLEAIFTADPTGPLPVDLWVGLDYLVIYDFDHDAWWGGRTRGLRAFGHDERDVKPETEDFVRTTNGLYATISRTISVGDGAGRENHADPEKEASGRYLTNEDLAAYFKPIFLDADIVRQSLQETTSGDLTEEFFEGFIETIAKLAKCDDRNFLDYLMTNLNDRHEIEFNNDYLALCLSYRREEDQYEDAKYTQVISQNFIFDSAEKFMNIARLEGLVCLI